MITPEHQQRMRAGRDRRPAESADDYPYIVVMIDKERVIECADAIQWIVQRKRGSIWHGVAFCRTKEALLRCTSIQSEALTSLPDRFPEATALAARGGYGLTK